MLIIFDYIFLTAIILAHPRFYGDVHPVNHMISNLILLQKEAVVSWQQWWLYQDLATTFYFSKWGCTSLFFTKYCYIHLWLMFVYARLLFLVCLVLWFLRSYVHPLAMRTAFLNRGSSGCLDGLLRRPWICCLLLLGSFGPPKAKLQGCWVHFMKSTTWWVVLNIKVFLTLTGMI